jgi:hypothetical protein
MILIIDVTSYADLTLEPFLVDSIENMTFASMVVIKMTFLHLCSTIVNECIYYIYKKVSKIVTRRIIDIAMISRSTVK